MWIHASTIAEACPLQRIGCTNGWMTWKHNKQALALTLKNVLGWSNDQSLAAEWFFCQSTNCSFCPTLTQTYRNIIHIPPALLSSPWWWGVVKCGWRASAHSCWRAGDKDGEEQSPRSTWTEDTCELVEREKQSKPSSVIWAREMWMRTSRVTIMQCRFILEAIEILPGHRLILLKLLPNFCQRYPQPGVLFFLFSVRASLRFLKQTPNTRSLQRNHGCWSSGSFVQIWQRKKWMWPDSSTAGSVIGSQARLRPINSEWCMCLHICVSSTFSKPPSQRQQSRLEARFVHRCLSCCHGRTWAFCRGGMFGRHGD